MITYKTYRNIIPQSYDYYFHCLSTIWNYQQYRPYYNVFTIYRLYSHILFMYLSCATIRTQVLVLNIYTCHTIKYNTYIILYTIGLLNNKYIVTCLITYIYFYIYILMVSYLFQVVFKIRLRISFPSSLTVQPSFGSSFFSSAALTELFFFLFFNIFLS